MCDITNVRNSEIDKDVKTVKSILRTKTDSKEDGKVGRSCYSGKMTNEKRSYNI